MCDDLFKTRVVMDGRTDEQTDGRTDRQTDRKVIIVTLHQRFVARVNKEHKKEATIYKLISFDVYIMY